MICFWCYIKAQIIQVFIFIFLFTSTLYVSIFTTSMPVSSSINSPSTDFPSATTPLTITFPMGFNRETAMPVSPTAIFRRLVLSTVLSMLVLSDIFRNDFDRSNQTKVMPSVAAEAAREIFPAVAPIKRYAYAIPPVRKIAPAIPAMLMPGNRKISTSINSTPNTRSAITMIRSSVISCWFSYFRARNSSFLASLLRR